jgi:dTDP-4-dehydrorhamnose reductase
VRLYLTGADGMVGTALTAALRADERTADWVLRGVSLHDYDVTDEVATIDSITEFRPDVVVHAAANAVVDDCEINPGRAVAVNVGGVRNVARACQISGSRLVYVSSDYVFDGCDTPHGGYREGNLPNPLSVYGLTKLGGERVTALLPGHLIIRTSWLFGGADERVDVVLQSLRRALRGEPIPLIADQYSLPTFTADLAMAMVFLLARPQQVTGTVHVANAGTASWYEVVKYALGLGLPVLGPGPEPVSLDGYPYLGRRPRNSTLNTERLASLGHTMPHWTDAVRRYCEALLPVETANR